MSDWQDVVVQLLTADTEDLRELAKIAGADPATFYRDAQFRDTDLSAQIITGMDLSESDLSSDWLRRKLNQEATAEWSKTEPLWLSIACPVSIFYEAKQLMRAVGESSADEDSLTTSEPLWVDAHEQPYLVTSGVYNSAWLKRITSNLVEPPWGADLILARIAQDRVMIGRLGDKPDPNFMLIIPGSTPEAVHQTGLRQTLSSRVVQIPPDFNEAHTNKRPIEKTVIALRVISKINPKENSIIDLRGSDSFVAGDGDIDYVCGNCRTVLLEGVYRGQVRDVILRCGTCRAYNLVSDEIPFRLNPVLQVFGQRSPPTQQPTRKVRPKKRFIRH